MGDAPHGTRRLAAYLTELRARLRRLREAEVADEGVPAGRWRTSGWLATVEPTVVAGLIVADFGLGHNEQGLTGWLQEGWNGIVLGLLYLGCGRRLAVPIVAHGVSNTLAFVLIFLNRRVNPAVVADVSGSPPGKACGRPRSPCTKPLLGQVPRQHHTLMKGKRYRLSAGIGVTVC